VALVLVLSAGVATAYPTKTKAKTHSTRSAKLSGRKGAKHSSKHARRSSWRHHGQQAIDGDRAREIQTALIREKYLDGEPTGKWDQRTKDAMQRFQEDNGWQTKVVPDSRALIKLGLGPSHDDLINPDTAMAPMDPIAATRNAVRTPQR
jgi:peptidoglycan hydrolase-like protein with peptidoglycan-binding domain